MATQTPNLNLDLREASDIFNPLSTNSNFETLDSVITEIRKKGGVPTYTTTASANLLKLSDNPVPNETLFKFVAAGDANTWSYQETVHNIVALDGKQKTVKGGEMYVAWVNAANAMVVIAWPDIVDAQTFDGKGPDEWATKAQLDSVNQTAANATQTAQAAATVANQALANAGAKIEKVWTNPDNTVYTNGTSATLNIAVPKALMLVVGTTALNLGNLEQCITIPTKKGLASSYKFEVDFTVNEQTKNNLRVYSSTVEFVSDGNTITQINVSETTRGMISASGVTNVSTGQSGIVINDIWSVN